MKHAFCLLLATFLLFSLAACGENSAPTAAEGTTATGEQLTSQPATEKITEPPTEATQPGPKVLYLCTEETYTFSDGGGITTRTYDENGNLLSEDYKSQSGDVGYGDSYTYDEKGNVLTHKSYDKYSQMNQKTTYTYNEAGQLISQLFTSNDGPAYTTKSDFTYNDKGLLVKKVDTWPENTNSPVHSEFHYVYSYDEKGNLIKEDWLSVNDGVQTPHSWKAWTYDAKGNKLSETDNRGFKTEWTYDDRGNMLSEGQYDDRGNFSGTTYTYDKENRLLTMASAKDTLTEAFIYEYDEGGHEIARYRCYDKVDKANAVAVFKSTYDENGNKVSEVCCTPEGEETTWRYYKYIAIELPEE